MPCCGEREDFSVGGVVKKAGGGVVVVAKKAGGGVADVAKAAGGGVADAAKAAGGGVAGAAKTVGGGVAAVGKKVGGGVLGGLKGAFGFVKNLLGKLKWIALCVCCVCCLVYLGPVAFPALRGVWAALRWGGGAAAAAGLLSGWAGAWLAQPPSTPSASRDAAA